MKDINTGTPPSLRPIDFPDEVSYEEWKHEESRAVYQLMLSMIEGNPGLLKLEPTEVLSSLLSDSTEKIDFRRNAPDLNQSKPTSTQEIEQLYMGNNGKSSRPDFNRRISAHDEHEEIVIKNNYTFIPDEPRAYYRRLVETCLKAQGNSSLDEDDGSLLSPSVLALLDECAVRWRVHRAARVALLLDVIRELYDNQDLGIEGINEGFSVADDWNYSSWPTADVIPYLSGTD